MNWGAIIGDFEISEAGIVFKGAPTPFKNARGEQEMGLLAGLAICSERFSSGDISARVEFEKISELNSCELVFYFDPVRRWHVSAGIGGANGMYVIRHWDGKWVEHAIAGSRKNLLPGRPYEIKVAVRGSRIALTVDGVDVLGAVLPFPVTPSQTGLWLLDDATVRVSNYSVSRRRGRAFVVMEFSSPFTELFDVIKKVCEDFQIDAHKADEQYGPGIVISDIARDIAEAEFVIAEITPANPNVYYELGYAHAINKPAILLANRSVGKAPFDVAAFRIMFYENSIPGRQAFEDGLRKHIEVILEKGGLTGR